MAGSGTPLGPVESWPQSLRTTDNFCLALDLPICAIWAPSLVQNYSDGYGGICGDKHPRSLGQNFPECWKEAQPVIGKAHDSALAGDTAFLETQHIFIYKDRAIGGVPKTGGRLEPAYGDCSEALRNKTYG